jgi:glucose/arabinose dehydrogenase
MRYKTLAASTSVLVLALLVGSAQAQDANLEKLGQFKTTGVTEMEYIPQGGASAETIKTTLERIKLPPGFKIGLYAQVPDARHMAVGPNLGVVFVGTRKTKVWAVTDRDKDRVADEVKEFAPSVAKVIPNGPCFSKDGFLFIAEQNRVLIYPAAEFFYESPDVVAVPVVAQGKLIPPEEESYNHTARVCRIGQDDKIYITLGQPFNVPAPEKADLYWEQGIGGIVRFNRDGTGREVYARGVRNSVGMDVRPSNGEIWFTDNQVDGMGDDIPPGELNRSTGAGQHFGFPWYGGGTVRTNEYKDSDPPADAIPPVVEFPAHAADLGMTFYTGKMFPSEYQNGVFSAEHGSWNRTTPIGARVMFTPVNEDGTVGEARPFAEGWLDGSTGEYHGRPVDVAQMLDGSLLVSDDLVGAIYRIWYEK